VSAAPLLLGIDEGTTAIKVVAFDLTLKPVAQARRPVPVAHPAPGRVEQDPELILAAVVDAVAEVIALLGAGAVAGAGLAHQGESVLAWDAADGRALTPVIVWQDKRQEQLLARLPDAEEIMERSGLPLDPYFSAGKMAWLLECDAAVQSARERGSLRLGTVDAFLADRLGGRFACDLSTASRTQLLALRGRDWDDRLLSAFALERAWLPAIGPTFGALGELRSERWAGALPLTAQLVDQQAALAGAGAVSVGDVKATYGTGVFVLGRTAEPLRVPGLLPTVAWASGEQQAYALDGGVFAAGSLLDWLAGGLGLAADAAALARQAATVPDSAGVMVLPALSGLGAPWWQPRARGVIAGLHGGVGPAHVARAALEAIAWRVADIVEAMGAAGVPVGRLLVDGGLTNDATLLRLQADALGIPLEVRDADATALGAAMLAGVGAGLFASVEDAAARLAAPRRVQPRAAASERAGARQRWRGFAAASAEL
jgi:glycerol kinase